MWTNSNLHLWPASEVWGEEKGVKTLMTFFKFFFPDKNVNLIFFLNTTQSLLHFLDIKINSRKGDSDKHPNF